MSKRAAICIGVNRAAGMTPLTAAARDARDFAAWAKTTQGCDITLLTDEDPAPGAPAGRVMLSDVFDAVDAVVRKRTYDQLIVYFSGHGILLAPGAEFWLLSRGPGNPNEAINLLRSVEDARNSGILHIVFVSDACRSAANTAELRAVTGGLIFPPQSTPPQRSEIDVYYATLPGDPANEVPEKDAAGAHRGLFTDCLLQVALRPPDGMAEATVDAGATIEVLSSRRLKGHLESTVPVAAAAISIKLNQAPEIRVETALPKYFARVDVMRSAMPGAAPWTPPSPAEPTVGSALEALHAVVFAAAVGGPPLALRQPREVGFAAEVDRLARSQGRGHFETRTGFSIHGANVTGVTTMRWQASAPFPEPADPRSGASTALHVRLEAKDGSSYRPSSIVLAFDGGTGTVLPVLPGFIGSVVVAGGTVVSVNFVPSDQTGRYAEYVAGAARLEEMKAFAAVASRNGRFEMDAERASEFADRIRQAKGIDPVMGLYAAYAYAQVGRFQDAYSVFTWMRNDEIELPILFDVAMLALRHAPNALTEPQVRIAPFAPMLAQGWTLLMPGDAMHRAVHQQIRPHLIPALFTTLDGEGVVIARDYVMNGEKP